MIKRIYLGGCAALSLILGALYANTVLAQKLAQNCLLDGGVNCNQPIPDGSIGVPGQLTSTVSIPAASCASVSRVCVALGIEHTWPADLTMTLQHGGISTLVPNVVNSTEDIYQALVLETEFDGVSGDGNWNLVITDSTNGEYGALNNWTLGLCCGADCGDQLVRVTPSSGLLTSENETAVQFDVELTCPPLAQVTIPVSVNDSSEGQLENGTEVVFTEADWAEPQTVVVTGVDDPDPDGDIAYSVQLGTATIGAPFATPPDPADLYSPPSVYLAADAVDVELTNLDNDTDLTISKTNNLTTVVPGQSLVYEITASNASPNLITQADVMDNFPPELSCSWTCAGTGGGICSAAGTDSINDPVTLPANASVTYTVNCVLDVNASGNLVNTATITSPAGFEDIDLSNNSATDTDTIGPRPDLSISDVIVNEADGVAQFIVTLNEAAATAFSIDYASADDSAVAGGDYASTNGTLNFSGNTGETQIISVPIIDDAVVEPTEQFLVNLSNISDASIVFDAQAIGTILDDDAGALLSATKTVSGEFSAGGEISYTLLIRNEGSGDQADNPGAEFIDVLPPQLFLQSATASSGTVVAEQNSVSWNGALAAGASVTITITAQIDPALTGIVEIVNQAQLAFDSNGDGDNDANVFSDDPALPGASDPTVFVIQDITPIPTLSAWALLLLGLTLVTGVWNWRRQHSG